MKYKTKNIFYNARYDGDIWLYQVRGLLRPLIKLLGFSSRSEIPLNIVLSFELNEYRLYKRLVLHLYRHQVLKADGQKLSTRKVKFLLLPSGRFNEVFLSALIDVLIANLNGQNIGLMHVRNSAAELAKHQLSKATLKRFAAGAQTQELSTPENNKKEQKEVKVIPISSPSAEEQEYLPPLSSPVA